MDDPDMDASASRSHCSSFSRRMTWLVRCACAIRDPALRRPTASCAQAQPPRWRVFVIPGLLPNRRPRAAVCSAKIRRIPLVSAGASQEVLKRQPAHRMYCVPPPGATPAPSPVPLRPRISLEQLDLGLQRRSRAEVLMHSLRPARPAAAAAARAPRPHSRSKPPCRCSPPACEVALDRSSSFTCRVGRVWRTRPTSLRRRPRGGAAARPPCAASRGRKLAIYRNQSVRGSSCSTTHRRAFVRRQRHNFFPPYCAQATYTDHPD